MLEKSYTIIQHNDYQPTSIVYGFIGRDFPIENHEYRKTEAAEESKKKVLEFFGGRYKNLSILHQIHSGDAVIVNEVGETIKADAQVTSNKEILLGIQTADCVPVIFVDEINGVVAAAHAGWKGAIANVIDDTIEKMKRLGANTDRIVAIVGPCISQKDYEVGEEFFDQFINESYDNSKFFVKGKVPGKFMFDLPSYVKSKLAQHKLLQVLDVKMNTYDEDRLFSYRKCCHKGQKLDGEILSVIGLL
jgi:polyphenol oxidase